MLLIGAGETGLALLRALSGTWHVVALDINPECASALEGLRRPGLTIEFFAKDGSSMLNLRDAGIERADFVAAVTTRDEVNLEISRLSLSLNPPPQTLAVVGSASTQAQAKALGAEPILRPQAIAGMLVNVIERGVRVAAGVGLGQGEIVEIQVLPSSPVVNVRLADLRARRWLVAAIYRNEQIVVPHGDAVIREGDRLLLSGEPDILPDIAEFFRSGVARFPLQYGRRFVALGDGPAPSGYWQEVKFLVSGGRNLGVTVLHRGTPESVRLPADLSWPTAPNFLRNETPLIPFLRGQASALDCGCLILPKRKGGLLRRAGLRRPWFAELLNILPCPTLLAAGATPFKRIVLPVTESVELSGATELAVDLSRQLSLPITAVTVSQPAFVSGDEDAELKSRALRTVQELAAPYRVRIELQHIQGNPVREIARLCAADDLLVLTQRPSRRVSLFRPDIAYLLCEHVPCSVMLLTLMGRPGGSGSGLGASRP